MTGSMQSSLSIARLLCLVGCAVAIPTPRIPKRLTVNGTDLLRPDGTKIRLTGFNWNAINVAPYDGDGDRMQENLPGANVARVVGIKWGNQKPLPGSQGTFHNAKSRCAYDCMTHTAPYFNDACFPCIDNAIQKATGGTKEVWVILALRGKFAAGGGPVNVFTDTKIRDMLYTALGHIAAHYKNTDYIAAYEPLAEPRVRAEFDASRVTDFYTRACNALQAQDPRTPCMIGPRSYYHINLFDSSILIPNKNVIYTFDYFYPDRYWGGPCGEKHNRIPKYPGQYECEALHEGWVKYRPQALCPQGRHSIVDFDKQWHRKNLKQAFDLKHHHQVPVFLNQWGAGHGLTRSNGRYKYMADIVALLAEFEIGWAYWTWRGDDDGWGSCSTGIMSGNQADEAAVAALRPYMSENALAPHASNLPRWPE